MICSVVSPKNVQKKLYFRYNFNVFLNETSLKKLVELVKSICFSGSISARCFGDNLRKIGFLDFCQ